MCVSYSHCVILAAERFFSRCDQPAISVYLVKHRANNSGILCRQMFPHMVERAIMHGSGNESLKDNVSIINATDLKPLVSIAENVMVRQT